MREIQEYVYSLVKSLGIKLFIEIGTSLHSTALHYTRHSKSHKVYTNAISEERKVKKNVLKCLIVKVAVIYEVYFYNILYL